MSEETDAEFLKRITPNERFKTWPSTLSAMDFDRLLALARRGAAVTDALAASEARLEKAREALKPFAEIEELDFPWVEALSDGCGISVSPLVGDLRRAAATLKELTNG